MNDRPGDSDMLAFQAVALIFVGRAKEALQNYDKIKERPLTPSYYNNYINALWCAGRIEEADRAMEDAAALYPTQAFIWFTQFNITMFGTDPAAAVSLLQDVKQLPTFPDASAQAVLLSEARAIESRDPAEANAVMAILKERSHRAPSVPNTPSA